MKNHSSVMNLPNKLTVIRMILTPVFLILFLTEKIPHNEAFGLAVYVLGCITDFLDGKIARKYSLVSVFGKLADPIADKMLTTAALLVLMISGYCSIYTVFIILTREFAVTGLRLAASAQGVVIPANIFGKIKTASQMLFTVFIMLCITLLSEGAIGNEFPLAVISQVLMSVTALFAVISGAVYIFSGIKVIDFNKN